MSIHQLHSKKKVLSKVFRHALAIANMVVGIGMLIVAGLNIYDYLSFTSSATRTLGKVVDFEWRYGDGDKKLAHPVVKYKDAMYVEHTFAYEYGKNPPEFSLGEIISVYYDPATNKAIIRSTGSSFGGSFFLIFFGIISLIMGIRYYKAPLSKPITKSEQNNQAPQEPKMAA